MSRHLLMFVVVLFVAAPLFPFNTFAQEETETDSAIATATDAISAVDQLEINQQQIDDHKKELDEIDQRINSLSSQEQSASDQAQLATDKLKYVKIELDKTAIELEQTLLSITTTNDSIEDLENQILRLEQDIEESRQQIRQVLRALYEHDEASILDIFLGSYSLGQYMTERRAYHELQQRILDLVNDLRDRQDSLATQQQELIDNRVGLQQLKEVQAYQQADLSDQKISQQDLITKKEAEQAQYATKIADAKAARQEIEQQIFTLKGTGIELALDDAFEAAKFASSVTGVRPSLLLAVLKVETNVGESLGSGSFPDDMHPQSRDAFLDIMKRLDRDPNSAPISRRPVSYQGWGGAMGPGQFMPATWVTIEARIATLMGKVLVDPYLLSNALVGTGIMLADRGATDPNREVEAISRYLAGPNWIYHTWYADRVLAVAEEYSTEGL